MFTRLPAAICLSAIVPALLVAQQPVEVSPAADKVLTPFVQQIESAKAVTAELKTNEQVYSEGQVVFTTKTDYIAASALPNKLALRVQGDDVNVAIVSDGKTLNMLLTENAYVQKDSPAAIADILDEQGVPQGPIIDSLLAMTIPGKNVREKLLSGLKSVELVSASEKGNEEGESQASTLKLLRPDGSFILLTLSNDKPIKPVAMEVDMTEMIKANNPQVARTPGFKFVVEV
ncbi:MAG: DUF2092 domain-containing protein, partial [Pirellulaceae bacterium]